MNFELGRREDISWAPLCVALITGVALVLPGIRSAENAVFSDTGTLLFTLSPWLLYNAIAIGAEVFLSSRSGPPDSHVHTASQLAGGLALASPATFPFAFWVNDTGGAMPAVFGFDAALLLCLVASVAFVLLKPFDVYRWRARQR